MAKKPVLAATTTERLTVKFQIGKYSGNLSGAQVGRNFGEEIGKALMKEHAGKQVLSYKTRIDKLSKRLDKAVEDEYMRGMDFAINHMIGVESGLGPYKFSNLGVVNNFVKRGSYDLLRHIKRPTGSLVWPALSKTTIQKKMARGQSIKQARSFFVDSGHLRQRLRSMSHSMVKRTGVIKILLKDKSTTRDIDGRFQSLRTSTQVVPVAELTLRLMPNIPRSTLPGLASGNFGVVDPSQTFESMLTGYSNLQTKLKGFTGSKGETTKRQRPLLQPVFTYWTSFYVPGRIAETMNKVLNQGQRYPMLYSNIWSSIVVFANSIISDAKNRFPGEAISFIDWEAHANINEMPNTDLIGPVSLGITEHSPEIIEANFSMGVSSYANDENLFRHRDMVAHIYEAMRPTKQVAMIDANSGAPTGFMIFGDGTMIAPLSRAETRPWQYIQASMFIGLEP